MIISGMNQGMNISDLYNFNRIASIPRNILVADSSVSPTSFDNETAKTSEVVAVRETLPLQQAMERATNELEADKALIGSTSDIGLLDVEEIMSKVRKDDILKEYQYFVSNIHNEDGAVIRKIS